MSSSPPFGLPSQPALDSREVSAPAVGRRGMVCSPNHLASAAGLDVLKAGGNAVDACVAVNAVLQVVYPPMCHLGGDGFWMVWLAGEQELLGLNGSGPAAAAASAEALLAAGHSTMPRRGRTRLPSPAASMPGARSLSAAERWGWIACWLRLSGSPAKAFRSALRRRSGLACSPR